VVSAVGRDIECRARLDVNEKAPQRVRGAARPGDSAANERQARATVSSVRCWATRRALRSYLNARIGRPLVLPSGSEHFGPPPLRSALGARKNCQRNKADLQSLVLLYHWAAGRHTEPVEEQGAKFNLCPASSPKFPRTGRVHRFARHREPTQPVCLVSCVRSRRRSSEAACTMDYVQSFLGYFGLSSSVSPEEQNKGKRRTGAYYYGRPSSHIPQTTRSPNTLTPSRCFSLPRCSAVHDLHLLSADDWRPCQRRLGPGRP
jgi:hypothetical protein